MIRYVGIGIAGLLTGGAAANCLMIVVVWCIPASAWLQPLEGSAAPSHEHRSMPSQLFAHPTQQNDVNRAAEVPGAERSTDQRPDSDSASTPPLARRPQRPPRREAASAPQQPEALVSPTAEGSASGTSALPLSEEDRTLAGRIRREVRRDDDGLYHIPRSLAEEVTRDRSLVRSLVRRVTPYESEDGTPLGIQLHGVGGLLSRVGVRDEDVLLSVNGIPLDAPQRGAAAARALRESPSITLVVYRSGRQMALRYALE